MDYNLRKIMRKIRHFMAVGAGAVITLSCVKPYNSPTLSSLTQLRSDLARTKRAATVDSFLGFLIASAQTAQAAGLPVEDDALSKPIVKLGKAVVAAVNANQQTGGNSSSRENLGEQSKGNEDRDGTPSIQLPAPVFNQVEKGQPINDSHAHGFIFGNSSAVLAEQNQPVFTLARENVKPAVENVTSSVQTFGDTVIHNALNLATASLLATPTPGSLQKALEPAKEDMGKPVSLPSTNSVAQSAVSVSPQALISNPGTPAPEFLSPSANPLLFPTQSEEVQVKATQPITLEQALELAKRNSRELQAARITLERNQASLREALAAEFPTVGLSASFTRSDSSQQSLQNSQLGGTNVISSGFSSGLRVNYDLYTAGSRSASIRAAEQQVRLQQLEIERTEQDLRQTISRAYYSLQQADAQVEISRASVIDAAQSLRDAQLQEQAGLGTQFDVLQAQVTLSNSQQSLTSALSQQRIARRQLVQRLSLPQQAEVSAADPIEVAGTWNLSLEQSIVLAYKNRAELEQYLVRRNIGEQQRIIALASVRPQAGLTATYDLTGNLNDNIGPRDNFALGANLQWNFFDGGAARARAQQARADIATAETSFAAQREQIRFDIEQAFFTLNSSAQNIQTASFALVQAQESLRLARLRFQAGVGTQTDVINQQTALTSARGSRLNAIIAYNQSLVDLQRAVSNLPDSRLFKLP